MTFPTRHPSLNFLWSGLILEELVRLGIEHICIAPGSRSAPLTLVAADHETLKKHVHFDERGLGFYALGLAKSLGQPVAVVTTSGTAVANLYPAIIEARQSGVPLVILTADRPPELIDCGANQAIEQQDIYAGYPGATLKLPTPDETIPASWVLTSLDQAFVRSCQQGLPLHVNCMFREPLYPDGTLQEFSGYLRGVAHWLDSTIPHTVYETQLGCQNIQSLVCWSSFSAGKGLLVAGRLENRAQADAVAGLARLLGWPLIADLQSQLHGHPIAIKHHDLLLAHREGKTLFREADRVFQVGGHLISKRLDRFLSEGQWQHYWMLGQELRRMDTGHCQTYRMVGRVEEICRRLSSEISNRNAGSNLEGIKAWKGQVDGLSNTIATAVSRLDCDDGRVTERWLGAHLLHFLSADDSLFVGNSLPVRLLDMFSLAPACQVYANRGASGIDGLIATAAGCAEGSQKPLLVVIGDLSFLHDLNSLQLVRSVKSPLALLVINNDGGGIFRLLPVDEKQPSAIKYFQTPHGLDAQMAARMFGIPYMNPTGCREVEVAVSQALGHPGCTLIEVKTRPGEAADQIRQALSLLETL